jgi:hypothetical protein
VFVRQRHPVLFSPERPKLENISADEMKDLSEATKKKIAKNYEDLMHYSRQLEVTIKEYNKFAKEQNQKSEVYSNIREDDGS